MSDDFISFSGMEADISSFIAALEKAVSDIDSAAPEAAMSAAEIIRNEQVRLFAKAHFKRDRKSHAYRMVNSSLITIRQEGKGRLFKMHIGYDTPTLNAYPELLVIEFGRPGKSRRRSSPKDLRGRKKGSLPSVSHIRAGFFLAKEKAAEKYNETLYKVLAEDFKG